MKTSIIILLAIIAFAGCKGPGQLVSTGYLVTVSEGIKTDWEKLPTTAEVDSFVYEQTGLTLNTDSLMESRYPFFQFRNGTFDIYVEKKAVYQRRKNSKKRWRVYDNKTAIN
jgi:hypothetical protein